VAELALRGRPTRAKRCRTRFGGLVGRLLLLLVSAIAAIALVETLLHLAVAGRFAISEVVVQSDLSISRDELLQVAGLTGGLSYFDVHTEQIERRVASLPQVRSVSAEKSFPNRVTLAVEARRPVAVAFAESGGLTRPLVIDTEGVVFTRSAALINWELPVISGLRFEGDQLGTRLPERLHPLLESLGELRDASPQLLGQFSEFRVSGAAGSGIQVLAYPVAHRIPIRLGDHIGEDLLKYAIMILDLMKDSESLGVDVVELDFRSGQAVLRSGQE